MARVTVEDCLKKIDNRFNLILIASKRVHQLSSGSHRALVPINGDKLSVVALREISEGLIDNTILEDTFSMMPKTDGYSMEEVEAELSELSVKEEDLSASAITEVKED